MNSSSDFFRDFFRNTLKVFSWDVHRNFSSNSFRNHTYGFSSDAEKISPEICYRKSLRTSTLLLPVIFIRIIMKMFSETL